MPFCDSPRRANTNGSFPDWLQIDFNGSKSIDEIDIYTVQDNAEAPTEPTTSTSFSLYGITEFDAAAHAGGSDPSLMAGAGSA